MLLSFPNWLIHLSSSLEWGVALVMLYRYGQLINRKDIRFFSLMMLPHWTGSWFVLGYHLSGDSIPLLLDLSETVNLAGSISLLYATARILKPAAANHSTLPGLAIGIVMVSGRPQSYMGNDIFDLILQISSIVYLSFLVQLIRVRKKDPTVFSALTIFGFWFVLVFILVTVFCIYLSTEIRGFRTLSHDDLLHGFAESLLSMSNLMIVVGIHRQTKRFAPSTGKAVRG
jgi:hypothetical protein